MRYLLLFSVLLFELNVSAQDDLVKKGQSVPNFTIMADNGKPMNSPTLDKKVVLINFFATWCGPCLKELPVLQKRVWEKYKNNKNFCLLVIGREHSNLEIKTFKEKHNFDLPMYPDKNKKIYSSFATKFIPRNYLINKDGKVVYLSSGYREKEFEEMITKLDELLK